MSGHGSLVSKSEVQSHLIFNFTKMKNLLFFTLFFLTSAFSSSAENISLQGGNDYRIEVPEDWIEIFSAEVYE